VVHVQRLDEVDQLARRETARELRLLLVRDAFLDGELLGVPDRSFLAAVRRGDHRRTAENVRHPETAPLEQAGVGDPPGERERLAQASPRFGLKVRAPPRSRCPLNTPPEARSFVQ